MADTFLVPYVRAVWRMLRYRLGPTGRVCLFGAGAHTRWLVSVISDLPGPTVVCILDDQPKTNSIAGFPVRQADSIDIDTVELVLVSSDRWEEELYARCKQLWGDRVEILRLYEGLPRGPYDKTDDRNEALRRIESPSPHRAVTERQIVIVSDQPRARESKLGYALKHAGWQPILLCGRRPTFDATRDFDEVFHYSNRWEALRLACDYSPVAYHVMVNSVYDTAELFVRHRPGVVIIDSYDLIAGMYTPEYLAAHPALADELNRERTCTEKADGI
ncbi:MAG: hypothetical protein IIC01_08385, partial [Planctomycetes bacterium]|nr:hypothetical protein [Planctomycetota bacterium]